MKASNERSVRVPSGGVCTVTLPVATPGPRREAFVFARSAQDDV